MESFRLTEQQPGKSKDNAVAEGNENVLVFYKRYGFYKRRKIAPFHYYNHFFMKGCFSIFKCKLLDLHNPILLKFSTNRLCHLLG